MLIVNNCVPAELYLFGGSTSGQQKLINGSWINCAILADPSAAGRGDRMFAMKVYYNIEKGPCALTLTETVPQGFELPASDWPTIVVELFEIYWFIIKIKGNPHFLWKYRPKCSFSHRKMFSRLRFFFLASQKRPLRRFRTSSDRHFDRRARLWGDDVRWLLVPVARTRVLVIFL